MGWTRLEDTPLDTIWEINDELWQRTDLIRREDAPPKFKAHGGRPPFNWQSAINGIIFRLRSGCQWNQLPKHFGRPIRKDRREKRRPGRRKRRRWVVERTLDWLSKCRGLLIRYDKHDFNYLGLIQLACALLWYGRIHRIQAV